MPKARQRRGTVLFFLAYNEEANLARVLQAAKKIKSTTNLVDKIVVLNDGSIKKKTDEIARRYADEVITFPANMGKARGFFEVAKRLFEGNTRRAIMLDADLKSIPLKQLKLLLAPLGRTRAGHKVMMSVGNRGSDSTNWSGDRAFLVESFKLLLTDKKLQDILLKEIVRDGRRVRGGYGLELFLNEYYTGSRRLDDPTIRGSRAVISRALFKAGAITSEKRSGRTSRDVTRLHEETDRMTEELRDSEFSVRMQRLISIQRRKTAQRRQNAAMRRRH